MTIDTSCRVRVVDFQSTWLQDRAREMRLDVSPVSNGLSMVSLQPRRIHRKVWEFAAIAQVYREYRDEYNWRCRQTNLPPSLFRSLGFGCGLEPLPAWLAAHGSHVSASDAPDDKANWTGTGQRSTRLADLPWKGICTPEQCSRIQFQQVDMDEIPSVLLSGDFDFTWSCGSFEHIGGIEAGLEFFCQQMKALKLGGIAAHTTEFNPFATSDNETLDTPDLCLFRESDLRRLETMLAAQGDRLWRLDLDPGTMDADSIVDVPPYTGDVHLSIKVGNWTTTSVLLVAERGGVG